MFHAAIAGTGSAAPSRVLTNADIEKMVDTSDEWIKTRTGISERRMAGEGDLLSDFWVEAGKEARPAGRLAAADHHTLSRGNCPPDRPIPGGARIVPGKPAAQKAASADLNPA